MDDLTAKFNALSTELLPEDRQKEIQEAIFTCEKMSAKDLMGELEV